MQPPPLFANPQAPLEARRQLLLPSRPDPEAARFLLTHTGGPAKGFSAESPLSLTALAVIATGHAEARGLAQDPTLYGARLAEGERAELVLTPAPGCVTVVAHGGLGVMEIDSFVVDGPADSPRVIGQDDRAGPVAVVGGQGACVALGGGAPRIIVIVRRGGGPVMMGVFRGDRPL